MSEETLLTELDEAGVLTVTINRPEVKNAFDTATQRLMSEAFYDASRNPAGRAVMHERRRKAFSSGGDVRALGAPDPGDSFAQQCPPSPSGAMLKPGRIVCATSCSRPCGCIAWASPRLPWCGDLRSAWDCRWPWPAISEWPPRRVPHDRLRPHRLVRRLWRQLFHDEAARSLEDHGVVHAE